MSRSPIVLAGSQLVPEPMPFGSALDQPPFPKEGGDDHDPRLAAFEALLRDLGRETGEDYHPQAAFPGQSLHLRVRNEHRKGRLTTLVTGMVSRALKGKGVNLKKQPNDHVAEVVSFVLLQLWDKKIVTYKPGSTSARGWLKAVTASQVGQWKRNHRLPSGVTIVSFEKESQKDDEHLCDGIDIEDTSNPTESASSEAVSPEPVDPAMGPLIGQRVHDLLEVVGQRARTLEQVETLRRYRQADTLTAADRRRKARLSQQARQDPSLRQEARRLLATIDSLAPPPRPKFPSESDAWALDGRVPSRNPTKTVKADGMPYATPVEHACLWCKQNFASSAEFKVHQDEDDQCLTNRAVEGKCRNAGGGVAPRATLQRADLDPRPR